MQLKYEHEVKNEPTKRFQHTEINERFSGNSISLLCNTTYPGGLGLVVVLVVVGWGGRGFYFGDFLTFFYCQFWSFLFAMSSESPVGLSFIWNVSFFSILKSTVESGANSAVSCSSCCVCVSVAGNVHMQ